MLPPGGSRRRITRRLNAAYGGGLLSDETFAHRIDQVLSPGVIDPGAIIGDLNLRRAPSATVRVRMLVVAALAWVRRDSGEAASPTLLALDWCGGQTELIVGRHHACDVVLTDSSVSRRHARLVYRDEKWIIQDLQSTNGTVVNGTRVGRCELRPGDLLSLGDERLQID
jgi:FHA domain